ncbi:MAG: ABC transporter ATP-binding protein [Gemmatimonadota bacterium]
MGHAGTSTPRRLIGYMRPYWGRFGLSLAAGFLASVLDGFTVVMLIPLLKQLFGTAGMFMPSGTRLEHLIDAILSPLLSGASPSAAAGRIVVVLVVGLLLKNALSLTAKQLTSRVEEGVVRDLRRAVYDHLLRLDFGFLQRTRGGELISAVVADTDASKGIVGTFLATGFQNLILVASSLVLLGMMSLRLTLLTLAAAPILIIGIRLLQRKVRRHARGWADQRGELTGTVAERLGAIRLIRAYGQEAAESERFGAVADRYRNQVVKAQRYLALPTMVSEIFGGLLVVLIIWAAATPTLVGQPLGPAVTITFLATALRMMSPIKALAQIPATVAVAFASAERLFELLDRDLEERDRPGEKPARFERDIVFDRVWFRYHDEEPVLSDISFTVRRGAVVAIVGPSGAGKTTLLDLVPRFHEPVRGEVRMDGVPLAGLTRSSLRALTGVVSQDTVLLNDTVRANIAYGKPAAGQDEIEAAARAANAAEFIAGLPNGYDTLLGERGTRLSGGQRQRIAIARALLRDPPILILDEATSALDSESERLVQDAIDRLMLDRTVLVVAHRLATVHHADLIVVLDNGRVAELGSHAELLAQDGLYRRLYDMQFRPAPRSAIAPTESREEAPVEG